ncbi:BLUF domain-containing protein [Polynucleobacter sp. AP-Reno-20A-A9]|uniref:BLUF domain-containing protein n=1 Tax=Polynucleobacter sp. AP-Reno-20A-A9 TaxID=2576925 RepID=UPI001C0CF33C|nr:BLUF domain-containing protein [Polynucleobacter sp. AP-Reno-20A-A9]MBU3628851.1 BLUF domain-containing protein [Polynucleobacter sp. AP-Reno-20A-A9]
MSKQDVLVELRYRSKAVYDFGLLGIMRLFEVSYHWNLKHGLTGVLFYDRGQFGQILEGKRDDVEEIWAKIQKDPRHDGIELLGIMAIERRRFPNWALKIYDGKEFARLLPQLVNAIEDIADSNLEVIKAMQDLGIADAGRHLLATKTTMGS